MKTQPIILLILTILLSTITIAAEYLQPGYNNNVAGTSYMDTSLAVEESTKAVSDPGMMPLVADLNNDGVNEIIILDDANVEVYQTSLLNTVDALSFSADPHYAIIYDIDADDYKEIMVFTTTNTSIIGFNGTNLNVESSFATGFTEGSIAAACKGTQDCAIMYGTYAGGAYATVYTYQYFLNTTNLTQLNPYMATMASGSSSSYRYIFCAANIPYLEVTDYDGDGINEYVGTMYFSSNFASPRVYLFHFTNDGQDNSTVDNSYVLTSGVYNAGSASMGNCLYNDYALQRVISSPLTYDFDGFPSNGEETVFGFMKDDNEFNMKMVSSTGVLLDTYPAVFDADGVIVSNPVLMNAFSDTGLDDFCILGYASNINEIDLLCGSAQTSGIESKEFNYDVSLIGNIALGTQYYVDFIQNVNRITNYNDGNDLSDVMTPYGMFYIDYDYDNELIPVYLTSTLNASHVSIDVDGDGRDDILELGTSGLTYITDGFVNSQVEITEIKQNPSSPVCTNTTLTFQVFLSDVENDAGNCTATLYYAGNSSKKEEYNVSFAHGQSNVISQFGSETPGIYTYTVDCVDDTSVQTHTALSIPNIMIITSNVAGDNCYVYNELVSSTLTNTSAAAAEAASNEEFNEDVDTFFSGLGVGSGVAKNILTLVIILLIAAGLYLKTRSEMLSIASIPIVAMVCFFLGLMSIFPLVVMILVMIALMIWRFLGGNPTT